MRPLGTPVCVSGGQKSDLSEMKRPQQHLEPPKIEGHTPSKSQRLGINEMLAAMRVGNRKNAGKASVSSPLTVHSTKDGVVAKEA